MTKKELVRKISEKFGLTQIQTKEIVQSTLDTMIDSIIQTGRIELRNFGVFEVRKRAPRLARNPKTGETVHVPAKKVIIFKPGRLLEERLK